MPVTIAQFFGVTGAYAYDSTHLNHARTLAIGPDDSLYVSERPYLTGTTNPDWVNTRIRKITPAAAISDFVRASDLGTSHGLPQIFNWAALAVTSTGAVIAPIQEFGTGQLEGTKLVAMGSGIAAPIAGTYYAGGGSNPGLNGDALTVARLPQAGNFGKLIVTAADDILWYEVYFPGGPVWEILTGSTVSTFGTYAENLSVQDAHGNFYGGHSNAVKKLTASTGLVTTAFTMPLYSGVARSIQDVMVGPDDNLYISWWAPLGGTVTAGVSRLVADTTLTDLLTWTTPGALYSAVLDSQGNMFGLAGDEDTIWKVSGLFAPVPHNPKLSTLHDNFNTSIDAAKWDQSGPVSIVSHALQLGDHVSGGFLTSHEVYTFDLAQVQVVHTGSGGAPLAVTDTVTGDYLEILVDPSTWHIVAQWNVGGAFGRSDTITGLSPTIGCGFLEYDTTAHNYFRIIRTSSNITLFGVSTNGYEWPVEMQLYSYGFPVGTFTSATATLNGNLAASYDNFNLGYGTPAGSGDGGPLGPPSDDFPPIPTGGDLDPGNTGTTPPIVLDPFTPGATSPASGKPGAVQPTCYTVLDLVRQFSGTVKKPIRITGPSTIEMVDINAPLPTGWDLADAQTMYVVADNTISASDRTLALESTALAFNARADFETNDIRLLVSDWKLPGQLPMFWYRSGLIKKVTYTFTGDTFKASVDFHYVASPPGVRRPT